ncbi:MAG: putative tryptophan/tyrosine transport system permease protein [Clostridiales bacterium]|nr:putative tryptophan/tyrosine transport system permease protein [Clostridiales bacterium]MDN5298035.1 putative tryptophan/tyrosine transport system permease protein [Clostridiales bacterium]
MILLVGSLQLGFLYAVMAMGIYISFRILNTPDLTVDGSFSLGMACAAVLTAAGHPLLALAATLIVGAIAGTATGLLQTKLLIHPILSGILVMTSLYTVNLAIMGGRSNLSVAGKATYFTMLKDAFGSNMAVATIFAIIPALMLLIVIPVFFKTRLGLAIRATGDNEEMVRASSINSNLTKCIGLAIANACVALSGGLISQYQMFSDVSSGSGMVIIGLASVIIGETLFGKRGVTIGIASAMIGSVIYRIIVAFALKVDLFPSYALKLISAVIVVIALSGPSVQQSYHQMKIRREVRRHAKREASTSYAEAHECKQDL